MNPSSSWEGLTSAAPSGPGRGLQQQTGPTATATPFRLAEDRTPISGPAGPVAPLAGATGTGMTKTLQPMADQMCSAIPAFLAAVKG